uniref:Uncharacterized protein n=1 Tax=Phytophthora fragariae TaxID=53985 RepID=A0A6A3DSK8_9STRA|nr:hypothetical protein PF009_g24875 [Phytophthora fragariae]
MLLSYPNRNNARASSSSRGLSRSSPSSPRQVSISDSVASIPAASCDLNSRAKNTFACFLTAASCTGSSKSRSQLQLSSLSTVSATPKCSSSSSWSSSDVQLPHELGGKGLALTRLSEE